ncbi:pseudouridylate synthase 1 homolog [Gastrophryne carolinensis]
MILNLCQHFFYFIHSKLKHQLINFLLIAAILELPFPAMLLVAQPISDTRPFREVRANMRKITVLEVHSRSVCWNILHQLLSPIAGLPSQTQYVDEEKVTKQALSEQSINENVSEDIAKTSKRKKKFAIMMAYSGHGYHGMQINREYPTIEGELIPALIKAQCLPETCLSSLKEVGFQRCARTDKGVSALAQVVSVKLLLQSCTNPVEKINSYLPPGIHVLGIKRVTNGFNSKNLCDARTYSYTLPTYVLSRSGGSCPDSSFRLPREDFHLTNRLLSFYRGTHNFHNFTNGKSAAQKSAQRHIIDIYCCEPFVHHGVEFARILVKGCSFMLHQIRKMVCLVIAVARGLVSADLLLHSVTANKVNIPLAPGLGLLLEFTHFDQYNRRIQDSTLHEPLIWEEFLPDREAIREERILPVIMDGELQELSMCHWLQRLSIHDFMNVPPVTREQRNTLI